MPVDFEVIFMDAGQGDCTLIVYPDGSLTLVDCGSTKSGSAALEEIKKVIDRKFQAKNDFSLVLTHPDEDHYNLLYKLEIERYLDTGPILTYYGGDIELYRNKKDGKTTKNPKGNYTYNLLTHLRDHKIAAPPPNSTSVEKDAFLSRAGVDVTIIAANSTGNPSSENGPIKNRNSIVLLVEYEGAKIFLMGDAFIETEQFIYNAFNRANQLGRLRKQQGETVVLKMGHHGSTTSTSTDWVDLIQPDILVVSAGTKAFGTGSGMPKESHLNTTIQHATLAPDTGISQSYVVYNDGMTNPEFVTRPKTTRGIWTTCYEATKESPSTYLESGQTWYYGVEITRQGKKLVPGHWMGYTGYEIDDDEDMDL